MQKNLLRIFIIIAVIGAVTWFMAETMVSEASRSGSSGFAVTEDLDEQQPNLALKNLKGEDVSLLKAHPGKTLLVNYWATWCPPCITEIPSLLALKAKRQSETFDVVFISLDFPEKPDDLTKLMGRYKLSGLDTLYMTDAKQWSDLSGRGLPITVLVSPEGKIMSRMVGGIDWTGAMADDFLKNVK